MHHIFLTSKHKRWRTLLIPEVEKGVVWDEKYWFSSSGLRGKDAILLPALARICNSQLAYAEFAEFCHVDIFRGRKGQRQKAFPLLPNSQMSIITSLFILNSLFALSYISFMLSQTRYFYFIVLLWARIALIKNV